MTVDLAAFKAKALDPLPGDNPCGVDSKFDPLYDQAVAQIQKLTSMSSAQDTVDLEVVARNGAKLLMETTKDMVLAGYTAYALLATQGYAGLAAGLAVYAGLLDTFWDGLCPPPARMKARFNAVEWLSDRLGDLVASIAPGAGDAESVREAAAAVEAIRAAVQARFEGEKPSVSNLANAIQARAQAAAPSPAPAGAAAQAAAAPSTAAAPRPAAGLAVEIKTGNAGEIAETIRRLANQLRAADPSHPLSYRVLRALKWDRVAAAPPHEGGTTRIPAPRGETTGRLAALAAAKNHAVLLAEAEDAFTDAYGTFFLDLQRHVHAALAGLGPDYAAAADAVARAAAAFVARAPGLTELAFDDGTPFADRETRKWLDDLGAALGGETRVVQVLVSPTARTAEKERSEAGPVREKLAAGDLEGALTLLQDAIDSETSPKLRFLRRIDAARHCLDLGEPRWARPILEELARDAGRFTLGDWEPELAREVERALVRCYRELAEGAKKEDAAPLNQLADAARDRLFAMDLRLAVAVEPRKKG